MTTKADIRLDILIKKEEDYYIGHCLQFDIVATDDCLQGVQKAILDLCAAHISFSIENDNTEHMFSPAPSDIWAKYYALTNDPACSTDQRELVVAVKKAKRHSTLPAFMIQEIVCNEQAAV